MRSVRALSEALSLIVSKRPQTLPKHSHMPIRESQLVSLHHQDTIVYGYNSAFELPRSCQPPKGLGGPPKPCRLSLLVFSLLLRSMTCHNVFSAVISLAALEYVRDPWFYYEEIFRVPEPGEIALLENKVSYVSHLSTATTVAGHLFTKKSIEANPRRGQEVFRRIAV